MKLAAHKFKLQALVASRGIKVLAICFLGLDYFALRFNQSGDKNGQKKFDQFLTFSVKFSAKFWGYRGALGGFFWPKCSLALLIDPSKFQVFPIFGKNFLTQKSKLIWAKLGQNWQKSAIRVMKMYRARAQTCWRLIFHHFIGIEISWRSTELIIKFRLTVAE